MRCYASPCRKKIPIRLPTQTINIAESDTKQQLQPPKASFTRCSTITVENEAEHEYELGASALTHAAAPRQNKIRTLERFRKVPHPQKPVVVFGGMFDDLVVKRLQSLLHVLAAVLLDAFAKLLLVELELEADLFRSHSALDHLLDALEEMLRCDDAKQQTLRGKSVETNGCHQCSF